MKKITKLKLGITLSAIILAIAYILDDIFYYSEMQLAEILTFPITIILIIPIVIFLILPYFIKDTRI